MRNWWFLFVVLLCATIGGLIFIIISYRNSHHLIEGGCYSYKDSRYYFNPCYFHDRSHMVPSIVVTALAGSFFLLSSCVIIKKSPHVRLPRIRIEWRQPEINETNIRNSNVAATVPATSENIETIYLDALESRNEIKEV